jgi:hypothetical protein
MSEAILHSSTHQRLEPFLILSKSVKGPANIKLIQDVLAAPGVYVFAELLECPNMMEVSQWNLIKLHYGNDISLTVEIYIGIHTSRGYSLLYVTENLFIWDLSGLCWYVRNIV